MCCKHTFASTSTGTFGFPVTDTAWNFDFSVCNCEKQVDVSSLLKEIKAFLYSKVWEINDAKAVGELLKKIEALENRETPKEEGKENATRHL